MSVSQYRILKLLVLLFFLCTTTNNNNRKNLMVGGDYKIMVKYEMLWWLNIGKPKAFPFFSLRVYGPRQSQGVKKKERKEKKTRPTVSSCHLDLTLGQ